MNSDHCEMERVISTSPIGTFKLYKGFGTGVEINIEQHLKNSTEIRFRTEKAILAGCYIEAISIVLQNMDVWLRIYFVNNANGAMKREKEFGRLLNQCLELKLERNLHRRISEFNKNRIKAIHGFIIGSIDYNSLEDVALKSRRLSTELIIFVLNNSGEVITTTNGRILYVGDIILNVLGQIESLKQQLLEQ